MFSKILPTAGILSLIFQPLIAIASDDLPTGASIISGDVSISNSSINSMDINQMSDSGIINWDSFSVGVGNSVNFDNGSGATLNRVTGSDLSSIYGSLSATGSIYLINESGIIFGDTGVVDVGGDFVGSTLGVDSSDFLNEGATSFSGSGGGSIVNLGSISSSGGSVSLLSASINNSGSIVAADGAASLVAGTQILMHDTGLDDGRFVVEYGDSSSITNSGNIAAAEVELRSNGGNIYALAGNTSGSISATGVSNKGGRVFLTSGDSGAIEVSGTVEASNSDGSGGYVEITGDTAILPGTIDVASSSGKGGEVYIYTQSLTDFTGNIYASGGAAGFDGGFVEVSSKELVSVNDGWVETGGGYYLIDPSNIIIKAVAGSKANTVYISPAVLITAIEAGNNNIVILTPGDTGPGSTSGGDITVQDDLIYTSSNSLTLLARGEIYINANLQNKKISNGGDINLIAGWDGNTKTFGVDIPASNATVPDTMEYKQGNATDSSASELTKKVWVLINDSTNEFDLSPFDGCASNLSSCSTFGNSLTGYSDSTGHIKVGDEEDWGSYSQVASVSAGTLSGNLSAFGGYVHVSGSNEATSASNKASSRLGYDNTTDMPGDRADITVLSRTAIAVYGGASQGTYAQIGNAKTKVGAGSELTLHARSTDDSGYFNSSFDILPGTSHLTYAKIGTGQANDWGTTTIRSDSVSDDTDTKITVTTAGGIILNDRANSNSSNVSKARFAQIGNGIFDIAGNNSGDITITSEDEIKIFRGIGDYSYSMIGHGGYFSEGNQSGNITVTTTGSNKDVILQGELVSAVRDLSSSYTDIVIGHGYELNGSKSIYKVSGDQDGGVAESRSISGNIGVTASGSVKFNGQTVGTGGAGGRIGHAGLQVGNTITGNIDVTATAGSINAVSGKNDGSFFKFGHYTGDKTTGFTTAASGDSSKMLGNITVSGATGVLIKTGEASNSSTGINASIGHGMVKIHSADLAIGARAVDAQGNIIVSSSGGNVSMLSNDNGNTCSGGGRTGHCLDGMSLVGHAVAADGTMSNSNILIKGQNIIVGDTEAATSNNPFYWKLFVTNALRGGNVTIAETDGSISLDNEYNISVNTSNSLTLQNQGNITIDTQGSSNWKYVNLGDGNLVLATKGNFDNYDSGNSGSVTQFDDLSSGMLVLYSTNPSLNTEEAKLNAVVTVNDLLKYNTNFSFSSGTSETDDQSSTKNIYNYSVQPTVTLANQSAVYGASALTTTIASATVAGSAVDLDVFGLSTIKSADGSADVTVTGAFDASKVTSKSSSDNPNVGTHTGVYGSTNAYVSGVLSAGTGGNLTVTRKALAITGKNHADVELSNVGSTTYEYTESGLVTGDTLTGALASTATSTGTYSIGQGTLTNANNSNYNITYTAGTITVVDDPTPTVRPPDVSSGLTPEQQRELEAQLLADREAKELAEREAKELAEREAKELAEREAKELADREAKELAAKEKAAKEKAAKEKAAKEKAYATISPEKTRSITDFLTSGAVTCKGLDEQAYAVDCLSANLEELANKLPTTGEYAQARLAFVKGAEQLKELALKNVSTDLKVASFDKVSRPLLGIKINPEAIEAINVAIEKIYDEIETTLLRSDEGSADRKLAYAQISKVVMSNKVLLRSE